MSVSYMQLKKWAGELEIPKGGFGMKKPRLISELVKAMKADKDDLDEEQLGWLAEQSGSAPATKETVKKKAPKKAPKKAKGKVTVIKSTSTGVKRKKKVVKAIAETPVVEEEPVEEDAPTKVMVDASKKAIASYAKELGISTKGVKTDKDYNKLGNEVFAEVDSLDEAEREELSKELFDFYTSVKGQLDVDSEAEGDVTVEEIPDEIPVPDSKAKLKVWAGKMGIRRNGKSDQDIAREILEEFQELDDDDKEDLPDALVEWANGVLEGEAEVPPEEDDDVVEVPDLDTLKEYALAVGIKRSEIKKSKGDLANLAGMIIDVYDEEDEGEYPPELIAFYKEVTGEDEEVVVEEEKDDDIVPDILSWLGLLGYDPEDFADSPLDEQQQYLVNEYKEDADQFKGDELQDAVAYLREYSPDLFKKKKKKVKK